MKPWLDDGDVQLYHGDVRKVLDRLPAGSARTCVTSPPYWGLRDYGTGTWDGGDPNCSHLKHDDLASQFAASSKLAGTASQLDAARAKYAYRDVCGRCGAVRVDEQIGLEPTLEEFITGMVEVFRGVRHVLADDGTAWVNMGDSFTGSGGTSGTVRDTDGMHGAFKSTAASLKTRNAARPGARVPVGNGLKAKDLTGQPWRLALALQADGWFLRSCIIWHKPNAMPESVLDRPSIDHEYIFLLAKSHRYYYDADAIREPYADESLSRLRYAGAVTGDRLQQHQPEAYVREDGAGRVYAPNPKGRNKRTVWSVPSGRYPGAHFATYPPDLIAPCVLAGSESGDAVLDPFMGSGTTAHVARQHGRRAIGVELNEDYLRLAADRLSQQSLLTEGAAS